MMLVRFLPVIVSCLLLAAHVLRSVGLTIALLVLLLPLLLLVRQSWVPLVMQVVLGLAVLEWARTAIALAQGRMADGEPWVRMVVILGAVAAVTAAAILILRQPVVRRYFEPSATPR
ncbi:MAG: hypothetical protein OEW06_03905 [Gemmatimonadota bacterium]|nr:hypothetical protein [Gemmatimonadota bacterium]MDH4349735.1 hypothetical protein [Gemmatimonadota bacterium]